jgi:hypothetical protein
LYAMESIVFTPASTCCWRVVLPRPAQYDIKAHAQIITSAVCLIIFLSKHALFLHFHKAQLIATKPKWCMPPAPGNNFCTQVLYCCMFPGMYVVPRQVAMIPHTHLAKGQSKHICSLDSNCGQKRHEGCPVHFLLLIILSLVRIALFSNSQP